MNNKTDYRIYAKELRKKLDIKQISSNLVQKIRNFEQYKNANNILIFYPTKYEIDLTELLNDNKNFYLPKVHNQDLLICPYSKDLKLSKLNILEPCTNPIDPQIIDLMIIPALMADKNCYRLGYGGGFYDKFLCNYPKTYKISALPKELIIDNLPTDKFDIRMNQIITY